VTAANTRGEGEPSIVAGPVTPMVPTSLTVGGPTVIGYGADARVAVRLTRPDRSHGLAGRTVTVDQRVHGPTGTGWQPLPTETTDKHGWIVLQFAQPQQSADFRFGYTAPAGWRDAEKVVAMTVTNHATSALSRKRVKHGHFVTLRGHAIPALAGIRVTRQAFYGGRWHSVGPVTTGPHGAYAFRFAPPDKGVHAYRVVVPGFDGRSHGYSPIRRLRVH
jgi:hypothetical protein